MDIAEQAFMLRQQGELEPSKQLFRSALVLEREAAEMLPATRDSEPSRSILFRSSASMAFNAGDYVTAERLVGNGLAGFPPLDVRAELQDLYEDINFMRHLEIKGLELDESQWLMSLSGNATSYGRTSLNQLMLRVEKVASLFYRTVSRMLDIPFGESVDKRIKQSYGLYINAFIPASFAVKFQVGIPNPQIEMFPELAGLSQVEPGRVIHEVMECLEVLERFNQSALRERIPDADYRDNFVGLAKQIAPDGDDIKLVGFKYQDHGQERPVALRKSREQLRNSWEVSSDSSVEIIGTEILTGTLNYANTPLRRGKFGTVRLTNPTTGISRNIKVPIAIMKDVVQPYYDEMVSITAIAKSGALYLEEIVPLT